MPKFNERGVIHLLLLLILLLGIAGGVLLVTRGEPFKLLPKAFAPKDQIDVLTDQLLTTSKEYQQLLEQSVAPSDTPLPVSSTPIPISCDGIGDVNSDGKINSTDSLIVLRIDAGYITPTDEQTRRADVNGDGKVNSSDSLIIQRYDAGFIKDFPVCAKPTPNTNSATDSAVQGEATSNEAEEKLNKMTAIAIQRKELLLQKIKDDPQGFLDKATLADKADQFPEEVRPYVEQKIEADGQLLVVHADDFENQKSSFDYFLQTEGEEKLANSYQLHFIKDAPQVLSGSEFKITGTKLEKQIILGGGCCQILNPPGPPDYQKQITAVLLINFADNANYKPLQGDKIRDMLFNTSQSNSANTYYRDNSYDKVHLNGNTYGWYTIDAGQQCDGFTILRYADRANEAFAKDVGKPISQIYKRVIYAFSESRCNIAGVGTLGEWKLSDGSFISMSWIGSHDVRVYEHEIGHNLGVHHANKYNCNVGTYTGCSEEEYGDIYDIMGNFWLLNNNDSLQFNAPHKIALGWLGEGEVQTVTKNNIYTIKGLEDPNPGVKVLKIKKPDTDEFYYVSYRQRNSANRQGGSIYQLPYELINGVSIHIWNEKPDRQTKYITAIYNGPGDLALADGKVFYDKINRIQVKQLSHSNGSVQVAVELVPATPRQADFQRVFVTSTTYSGKLDGVVGADQKCQVRADAAKLGGAWKAWISDDKTSPFSRFKRYTTPYKLLNGQVIANNWDDLQDKTLQAVINIDENGVSTTQGGGGGGSTWKEVWTGTYPDGQPTSIACTNWTSDNYPEVGTVGDTRYKDYMWTYYTKILCAQDAALYCFEETAVSSTPKPTPSPTPAACTACGADINKDGVVDIGDYSYLVSCFNKKITDKNSNGLSCAPADINDDGLIDEADNTCLNSKFGQKCQQGSAPTLTLSPVAFCNGVGDVNQDGKIDATDSLVALRINAGFIKPTDEQKKRADVNGDGSINSIDSLLILRYNAGFIKTFPVCSK